MTLMSDRRGPLALALALAAGLLPAARAAQFHFPHQTLTVPDGFEVELVAGPPLVLRPMMADFDEQGRLYVADSSGANDKPDKQLQAKPHRIVRLEDTDGDGRFDRSTVFADKMMFPEGVLWFDGAVYSGAPPTIWKLEDTDGDGVADRRTEWHQGKTLTGCANDLHGPYLGPDGWIYWCKGAFAQQTYERPGHRTIADSAAHVFRASPDHRELDAVMSGGMDNPVELAWTPEGELFFITTFFHHPEAGRRDAIVHCIYGGAYPKPHGVLDNVQQTGALLPPLVELGPAAACALTCYQSRGFGPEFEGNLFSTLFNLRRVMRHILTPVGGTYTATNEDFLVSDNPDFHPTDVLEDADGSLLVIDTGGWYKICCPTSQLAKPDVLGAIYRVRRKGMPKVDDPRGLRLAWATMKPAELVKLLDDARPAVREHAIRVLAKQGAEAVPALAGAARGGATVALRRNAVWALTRMDDPAARAAVRPALDDSDPGVQRAALHSAALHRDAAALPKLLAFLKDGPPFQQRKAAEALGRIGDRRAAPALLEAAAQLGRRVRENAGDFQGGLDAPAVRIQEHTLIFALIEIADRERTAAGLSSSDAFTRRAALIALDQMDHGGLTPGDVTPLLAAPDLVLKQTASWIVSHHADWGGALAGFLRDRLAAKDLPPAEQAELQGQLARFAGDGAIQDLMAETAANPAVPSPARVTVLAAMAGARPKETPRAWSAALARCLADADETVCAAAVQATHTLPAPKTNATLIADALLRLARDARRPARQRLEALRGLPAGLSPVSPELFELLLGGLEVSLPPEVRQAAATVLGRARLDEPQLQALADALRTVGPMELNPLLGAFDGATNEAVGLKFVAALKAAQALRSVRVDVLQQRLAQFPASVQPAGKELLALLDVNPAQQAEHLEQLLAELHQLGGDIRRGQAVFNSAKTACATCHTMGYVGGRVGPDLTSIGQVRTPRDLLEAIVYPSASFVRSFEPVIINTKDGEEYGGIVRSENDAELLLVTGPTTEQRIARADIAAQRPGTVSLMPQGFEEQLTKPELADLLAFLQATKWGPQ